jgi:ABC-type transporter Mla MlaB component
MLRITIKEVDSADTWELEGKLSGEWVEELGRCWKGRASRSDVPLQVQLKSVSYIDAAGRKLLAEMHASGVEIRGCGCMARSVVEEIMRAARTH